MDYYLDPTSQYPFTEPTCHAGKYPVMRVLEQVFDPSGTRISAFKDCVLISLDIEYDPSTQQIHQVGVARLDTREIWETEINVISSRLLLLKKRNRSRGRYLYGYPEQQYNACLESLLLPIFTIADVKKPTLRNIVLVGHGIKADIEVLKCSSNFDIIHLPMVKAIVDTSPLVNSVFNIPGRNHSLRRTCTYLGMYRRNMHNAGNDAMYTLKALLLLFHHYKDQKLSQTYDLLDGSTDRALLYECHLEAIKRIGRCNNGIGRFAKKRRKPPRDLFPREKVNKTQDSDVLNLDEGATSGLLDQLFSSHHRNAMCD